MCIETISIVCRQESIKDVHTQRLLKQILQKISDKTEFLVEDKLFDLLKPYTVEQKTLVCLDNVFNALGIHKIDDINSLKDYFLPYAICQDCNSVVGSQRTEIHSFKADEATTTTTGTSMSEGIIIVKEKTV